MFRTMERERYVGPGVADAISEQIADAVINERRVTRIRVGRTAAEALSAEFTALSGFGARFAWTDESTFHGHPISRDAPNPGDVIVESTCPK